MRKRRRSHVGIAIATVALSTVGHAAIRAQSGSTYLQVLQGHGPSVLAELPGEFSFFMWLRRTSSDVSAMFVLEAPGAFDLLLDPQDQTIRLHRGGQKASSLELVLSLHDGGGQVPLDEWILIGASWDGSTGDFKAWARSENVARVADAVVAPGFVPAPPQGDLTLGNPRRGGTVAQQGDYGLIVFRDHAVDGGDFDDVWDTRDYFGGYRVENQADGGNLNGIAGVNWMANHAILTNPVETVTGIPASAAMPGDNVASDNYCALNVALPSSTEQTTILVTGLSGGPDAFQYFSPYDDGGSPFFVRQVPQIAIDNSYVSAVSPKIRQLALGTPQQLLRCVVSANSRGMKVSDADNRTWPEHYAHGFTEARLAQVAGVLNRPARLNANLRWFGFDTDTAPANSGLILRITSSGAQQGFGRLWTNSGSTLTGPGEGLWLDQGSVFALKAQPEPGSLLIAEAPLVVRAYLLRFPGAGTLSWRPVKSTAQHVAGSFGAATSVDLGAPASWTRVLTEADIVDPTGSLSLDGDHSAQVTAGDAVYISAGTGQRGIAVISDVSSDGITTEITFEHWFQISPTTGSTLEFGPWEVVVIEYEWPALSESDPEQWRGLELTAVGGPLVNFAWDAWRPDVNGFVFGGAGWGGNGYTPQLAEAVAAATTAWMQALEPDVWLQGIAGQNSQPPVMNEFLGEIRNAVPDVEVAWLGEGAHRTAVSPEWHIYLMDAAGAAGVAAVTMVTDDAIGTWLDQAVDGLRNDGAHMSHRGNTRLAEGWLAQLGLAARIPADLDGDGHVGINDFLLLLAAWGPCPGPPDPCLADIDGDGMVGVADFLLLLGVWGSSG